MKKYILSLVAISMVLSIAFLQCTSSATADPKETIDIDTVMSMKATERIARDKRLPVNELTSIDKPTPIPKETPTAKPKPVKDPTVELKRKERRINRKIWLGTV